MQSTNQEQVVPPTDPGFSLNPGSTVLVEGNYSVEVVQTQVVHSGEAGKEGWLGVIVKLRKSDGEVITDGLDAVWNAAEEGSREC